MSTYTDASLIVTPNAYKAGKLYSLKPTDGSGDLGVVRATTATYVDADGVIQTALANEPRFDYSNGSCPSILIEPQRTNLVFPSATATTQTRTVTAVAHTLSFYGTGSVALSGVATGTLVGTGTSNRVTLTFTPTAGSLILTVVGSVTNWQLEAGANATSYIPTVGSIVTRNEDVISKTGISDLINSSELTLFIDFDTNITNASSTINMIILDDGTTSNYVSISIVSNYVYTRTFSGGVFKQILGAPTSPQRFKIAVKIKQNSFKFFRNGIKINEITDNNMPTGLNRIKLGEKADAFINTSLIFQNLLTDQECIDITTL